MSATLAGEDDAKSLKGVINMFFPILYQMHGYVPAIGKRKKKTLFLMSRSVMYSNIL